MVEAAADTHECTPQSDDHFLASAWPRNESNGAAGSSGAPAARHRVTCLTCEDKGYYRRGDSTYQVCLCHAGRRLLSEGSARPRSRYRR